mmetsp:Transcript_3553/g.11172  ORF Transcript_3553/g.11172 Transcript_3553/m.11172 type:complete len:188 (-) Transcript_3553:84-647(-)
MLRMLASSALILGLAVSVVGVSPSDENICASNTDLSKLGVQVEAYVPFAIAFNGMEVVCKEELTAGQTSAAPEVAFSPSSANALYTLAMVDPDAPAKAAPWLHWLVHDIPGSNVAAGTTLVNYAPPTPPRGTGPHRYIMMLFEQPGGQLNVPSGQIRRSGFNLATFLEAAGAEPSAVAFHMFVQSPV